jgi:hypothetical protein
VENVLVQNQNSIICLTKNGLKMENLQKFYLRLLSGMLLIILFNSCENSYNEIISSKEFINPYEYVGEMHNEGLVFVIEKIKDVKASNIDIQDLCNLTTAFMLSKEEFGVDIKSSNKFADFESCIKQNIQNGYKSLDTCSIFKNGTKANKLYLKLDNLFNKIDIKDTIEYFKAIKKFEYEIWISNISESEKAGLLLMSSVGRHSFSFWKENLSKYFSINLEESKNEDFSAVLLEILKADMIGSFLGFVAGAIIGAIGGTLIMPGVGSITAAFLEGMQSAVWGAILGSIWQVLSMYVFPLLMKSELNQKLDINAPFQANNHIIKYYYRIYYPIKS